MSSLMSARTSLLFQQKREFFEAAHTPQPIFLPPPLTPPGHSSRMSRLDFTFSMDTKRCSSMPASPHPPAKPKRTFAHDIYMANMAEKARKEREERELEREQKNDEDKIDKELLKEEGKDGGPNKNVTEGCTFGVSATKMISRYEQLASDAQLAILPPHKKEYSRPESLASEDAKIVPMGPLNGVYCTKLEIQLSPRSPCESPMLLKSAIDEREGNHFQFKIRRRNGIRERDTSTSSKKEEEKEEGEDRARRKNRAVLIRKHTLEAIKRQNDEILAEPKSMLFDSALIVSIERVVASDGTTKQVPKVTFTFGSFPGDNKASGNIPYILYPDVSHATQMRKGKQLDPADHSFFIALTDESGVRTYAYCIKFGPVEDEGLSKKEREEKEKEETEEDQFFYPCVFAIITRIRDPSFYFDLGRKALRYAYDLNRVTRFLTVIHDKPHPRKAIGGVIVVEQRDENGKVELRSEICTFGCEPRLKMGWSVNDLVRQLTPEWTTCIIAAALAEQRVLITGSSVHEVTRAVQAIDCLLRPFEWPFCFIPCVPDDITDMCDNPSPYLIGILRHNLNKIQNLVVEDSLDACEKNQSEFVLFDIDRGLINPIPLSFKNNKHFDDHDHHHFRNSDEKEREAHLRRKNCYTYCKRVGMPRKVAKGLVELLEKGLAKEKSTYDCETCTEAMLIWYATIFGHYKSSGATVKWDRDTKATMVEKQSQPSRRDYLEYLVESVMFNMWIERRQKAGDRTIPEEELEEIDAIFEQVAEFQNYKRKKPVKHAFGKLFGTSRRH